MSLPADATRIFWGVNTTFFISGAKHTAVANIQLRYGYRVHEELVTGTNNPYLGTGGFHGELEADALGASDTRFDQIVVIASGQVRNWNVQWIEGDTQGTPADFSWVASGVKFSEYQKVWERDNVVRVRLRGTLMAEPTVS